VSKPTTKPRKTPAAGLIARQQLDNDPFGEMAFKTDRIDSRRPGTPTPEPFPAAAEDDPFGDVAAARSHSRHSNFKPVTDLDPFGEGMSMNATNIPRVRKATPVVRFAEQVPPSKKRKLAGASPVHPPFPNVESPSASPEPPNALEKTIEAAGERRNGDQTTPGPSSAKDDPRQVVRMFLGLRAHIWKSLFRLLGYVPQAVRNPQTSSRNPHHPGAIRGGRGPLPSRGGTGTTVRKGVY